MGSALLKRGKSAEAGVAFREAALDEANPDPTRALLNLGVCFMALNRPADAVASYESALQFDMQSTVRNKLGASLGQAYVACGHMQKAVDFFEKALADKTYFLSASASVDYKRAIAAVSQGNADETQVLPALSADISGLDVPTSAYADADEPKPAEDEFDDDSYFYADAYNDAQYGNGDERFFNASDEELEQWSRGVAKQERRRRSTGLKVLVALILVVVIALAAGLVLYTQGFGWPTQEAVAAELFSDPASAPGSVFSPNVGADDAAEMAALVPADPDARIDGVSRTMSTSSAYVTARTDAGAEVQYKVDMVRELVGWKVSNVELYFASQH